MTEQALPLMTFYKGWASYQRSLIETIAPLSIQQLALPAASHQWTIGMIVQHMVANRVWWFQVWMGEGNPDLAPIANWNPGEVQEQPALDATALVAGLQSTWQMIADALARWTPADLEQVFSPPATLREEERENFPPRTLQWILWHVLEHEIHHGGELSLALGGYGLPGIYGNF
ncbi:DinB family protein [Dictyobacter arantiisoli]|uniref:DinB-like domain-containing protein n=1 Tax=Dictyobacter arantiisoli TaxID=2014874 RepID=A0A5A5TJM5_9CHLR|nr:DinB family protein [Dictyobacter arantiisoli]GCF11223.1 hypothetical protein KDI_47870 [Dictyobacter arantiisoli]